MSNRFALIGAAMVVAFSAGGCALAGDGDTASTNGDKSAEPSSEVFEVAPEGAEPIEKEKLDVPLSVKGGTSMGLVKRAYAFEKQITLPQGVNITCTTSNGTSGVDTVLALIRRDDGYPTGFMETPNYRWRGAFSVMDQDDDGAGYPYSRISYTSPGGQTGYRLLGFAYGNSTGQADVTCTYSDGRPADFWGQSSFTAGSVKSSCNAGAAHAVSPDNGDPSIIVIPATDGDGAGVWNDDARTGGNQPWVESMTNQYSWFVMWGYGFSGESELHCGNP